MRSIGSMVCRLAAVAAGLAVCLLAHPARAGIAVSPLKQEITVKPGQTVQFKITVTNNSRNEFETAESVRLEVMDVAVSDEGALVFAEPNGVANSASRWIRLGAQALTLEPGKSRHIECKITAPATSGEFYSAIMVTIGNQGENRKGLPIVHRIASGVFVTVSGRTLTKEAKIARCEVVWPTPTNPGSAEPVAAEPAKVAVLLKNTGQARFEATGKVAITDFQSRTVFSAPLASLRPCVFAGDGRLFVAALLRPLPAGQYMVRVEFDYQSQWGKAYARLPLEITPEQAGLLKAVRQQPSEPLPVQSAAQKLSAVMLPGAFRSLSLTLRNAGENQVRCTAKLTADGGRPVDASWITIEPQQFVIAKSASKTVEFAIRVGAGAAPGRYASTVLVEASAEGGEMILIRTPLEVEIKGNAE
jgi:hypothetical protein